MHVWSYEVQTSMGARSAHVLFYSWLQVCYRLLALHVESFVQASQEQRGPPITASLAEGSERGLFTGVHLATHGGKCANVSPLQMVDLSSKVVRSSDSSTTPWTLLTEQPSCLLLARSPSVCCQQTSVSCRSSPFSALQASSVVDRIAEPSHKTSGPAPP